MTIKGTIISILMVITLMVFAANTNAEEVSQDPQADQPPTLQNFYRVNRDVPCTSLQVVQAILAQRGQLPIAQGKALATTEVFDQIVLTLNDRSKDFSLIIINSETRMACNIYSGQGFSLISQ
jgi:hypothetical protein